MRKDADSGSATGSIGFTSARTLLAILRISQALARLRCSGQVRATDALPAAARPARMRSSTPHTHTHTDTPWAPRHPPLLPRPLLAAQVEREDIIEARRLMSLSRSSVLQAAEPAGGGERRHGYTDPTSIVYRIISEHAQITGASAVNVADVLEKVIKKGRTREELEACMDEYADLNIWQLLNARTVIRFVDAPMD